MDTQRTYKFEHGNSFNLETAKELIRSHRYKFRKNATLGTIRLDVIAPEGANLKALDGPLTDLGGTLLTRDEQ